MIYLIYGQERFLVNRKLEEIKDEYEKKYSELSLGLNYIVLNNLENIEELISEIEIPPFGYENKLIIVRESDLFLKANKKSSNKEDNKVKTKDNNVFLKEYFENNKKILDSVEIVFIETEIDNKSEEKIEESLYNYIKKNGKVFQYNEYTKKDNLAIINILEEYIKDFNKQTNKNIKINRYDLNFFIEEAGRDIYTLLNDLDKLLFYSFNKDEITKEDIENITIKSKDSIIFDISNNILSGNYNNVIKVIDKQIYSGNDIYILLGYIYGVYREIYLVSLADETKNNPKDIFASNRSFLIDKYRRFIRTKGRKSIERILFEIMEIDRLSKIGAIDPELGIKALLR